MDLAWLKETLLRVQLSCSCWMCQSKNEIVKIIFYTTKLCLGNLLKSPWNFVDFYLKYCIFDGNWKMKSSGEITIHLTGPIRHFFPSLLLPTRKILAQPAREKFLAPIPRWEIFWEPKFWPNFLQGKILARGWKVGCVRKGSPYIYPYQWSPVSGFCIWMTRSPEITLSPHHVQLSLCTFCAPDRG